MVACCYCVKPLSWHLLHAVLPFFCCTTAPAPSGGRALRLMGNMWPIRLLH